VLADFLDYLNNNRTVENIKFGIVNNTNKKKDEE